MAPPSVGAVVSFNVNPAIVLGPSFRTVIKYVTDSPATGAADVLVFSTFRSAFRSSTSVTVEVLSSGSGSVTPAGGVAVAVFTRFPLAAAGTIPVSVIVTDWPVASDRPVHAPVTGSYEPALGAPNVAPPSVGAVVSFNVNPAIVLGPSFRTVIR